MKAQRPLGLALAWLPIVVVFLLDVAIMVLVSNWPDAWRRDIAWWSGVGVAAVVALAVLLTYRGVPVGKLAVDWVRNFFTKVEPKLTDGRAPAVDHRRRYGHATVGLREDRGAVVAVVAVAAPVAAPSGRHSQPEVGETRLPVRAIADGLRQFDVHLDGIDIVTVATRDAGPAQRRPGTWLVLRMNPQRNVGAVAVRDSVASTMAAAAERIADDLSRRRIEAWPLTADELGELGTVVLAGLKPADSALRLRFIKQSDGDGA
ncbi:MAG TPA: type VII secretion protein EccE, partial [Mycobacterium sp.]|nr:type VII secretion protein EccE [Mycobacterium sp.]